MHIKNLQQKKSNMNTSSRNSLGFTLVELSIVIIIFGVIATLYINMYRVWQESKNFYIVESNIDNAFQAISLFRADSTNQRYPLP